MEIIQNAISDFCSNESYDVEQLISCAHHGGTPVCSCDNKQQKPQCVWDY